MACLPSFRLWNSSGGEDVYSYNFPGDRSLIKLLGMYYVGVLLVVPSALINSSSAVYSVFLLETVQTALTGADLYYWFVTGFGNPAHLASPSLSPVDVPIIGSIVSFTVQLFFVYRIWVLGGRSSWPLCLLICLVSRSYQPRSQISPPYLSVLYC
jgi:hypothetical protein